MAALAAILAMGAAAHAQAASSPTDIINHHITATNAGDIDGMMSDYADNAVVLQAGQAVEGKTDIRALFTRLFGPGAAQKLTITPTKIWEVGDVGLITWTAGALQGQDSFVVRNGKIETQAVWIGGPPAPPAGQ